MFSSLPLILDGGTGSHLSAAGKKAEESCETFILEHPDVLIGLQKAYVEAGSRLLMSPTFGANRINMQKYGVKEDINSLCERLVSLSRLASGGKALIAGDIAPTGLMPEPFGDTEDELFLEVFSEQAKALNNAGVDLFAIETQLVSYEAKLALDAVRSVSSLPVMLSFSVTASGRTFFGEDICDIWKSFENESLSAFGINCIGELDALCDIISRLSSVCNIPIIAKPNAGLPDTSGGVPVYSLSPEKMGSCAVKLYENGARLIGGCCGTGPEHIKVAARALACV